MSVPMPDIDDDLPASPTINAWIDGATVVRADQLIDTDFATGAPFVTYAFHGTPVAFDRFDPKITNNLEAQFGPVIYLTSDPYDAWHNYALETGPDLTQRLTNQAQLLADEMAWDPDHFGLDEDADFDAIALATTRQKLLGTSPRPRVLGCAVRFSNPFVLGTYDRWVMPGFSSYDDIDTDVPYPDDSDDDALDAYYESLDAAQDVQRTKLIDAFSQAEEALNLPHGTLEVPLALLSDTFDATSADLEHAITDAFSTLEHPDDGTFLSHAVLGAVVRALGFDAILLMNANQRFRTIDMHTQTVHVHVFEHTDANLLVLTEHAHDEQETALAA